MPRISGLLAGCVAVLLIVLTAGGLRADLIGHGGMVRAVDVSPDGRTVITASFDFTARLWDFGTQAEVAVLDAHEGPVTSAVFTPDGKYAVTTSDDATAIIWDVPSGKLVRRLTGHGHKVMAAAVSPDSRRVVTGSWDKSLRIWDLATGKAVRVITHSAPINDVAFVNGGNWVTAGGHVKSGETVSVLTHSDDRTGQVFAAAVSPDGGRALSAGRDGRLVEWDLATGDVLTIIPAHDKIIWAARFAPDGRFALTASADETTAVWHLETGDRIGLKASDKTGKQPWLASDHPGARLYTKCANCHALNAQAASRSGPHFEGLWGRRVGAVEGYNYSGALRNKSFTWNEKTLFDLFYKGPDKFLPGTKMPVQRVPDREQLANLVDYLRVLTDAAKQ